MEPALSLEYRQRLVDHLVETGWIKSERVRAAFMRTPREHFIEQIHVRFGETNSWLIQRPEQSAVQDWLGLVYSDHPLAVSFDGQAAPMTTSTAPWLMAAMIEALDVDDGSKVLEIGTGTGFNAGVLAALAGPTGHVSSVEIAPRMCDWAVHRLDELDHLGVRVVNSDGAYGLPDGAPYDRIIATASSRSVPGAWFDQLAIGGRLVMSLGGRLFGLILVLQKATAVEAVGYFLDLPDVRFVPLVGPTSPNGDLDPMAAASHVGRRPGKILVIDTKDFDPAMLIIDQPTAASTLGLFLELAHPRLCVGIIEAYGRQGPYVIDPDTATMLWFVDLRDGRHQLEVRGDPSLWEALAAEYRRWDGLGRPRPKAFSFEINAAAGQTIHLHASGRTASWSLQTDH